jgi:hypothetical protein
MSRQKQKGNAYERVIAEHLTSVFNMKFFRSPGSGDYVGGRNFHRANEMTNAQQLLLEGDIVVPEELGKLKFECKTLKKISFSSFYENNALLDSWIEQAKSDDKMWFLVFKINNRGSFVVTSDRYTLSHAKNKMHYKDCLIQKLDGFFENNKEHLLNFCLPDDGSED